jgi:IS5 family transposase
MGANPRDEAAKLDAFRGALEKLGYIDGQTIRIELRYAMGQPDRFGSLARELESVVPWSALCAVIEPFYPKPGNGSPPVGVERMLRIYSCSNGSICRTRRWKRRCTIRRRCAAL